MEAGWMRRGNGPEGWYMAETSIEATWLVMTLFVTR